MSIEELRNRNKNGKLDKLLKATARTSLAKESYNNDTEDTYYPERNKEGNASCVIRFLPGLESEEHPYFVERFQHGFKHNGRWFIEYCPSTIGKKCPVCDYNYEVVQSYGGWKKCPPNIQQEIRDRGRNRGFSSGNYCNILVIKDPQNPENEGKVHLFAFKKAIMDMILEQAQPVDYGLGNIPDPVDVFDLKEGANFNFVIRSKDGRADYSKSSFDSPSECPEFDMDSQFPLLPITDESIFKSYDELKKKMDSVLGVSAKENVDDTPTNPSNTVQEKKEDPVPQEEFDKKEKFKEKEEFKVDEENNVDDNLDYFKDLAESLDI